MLTNPITFGTQKRTTPQFSGKVDKALDKIEEADAKVINKSFDFVEWTMRGVDKFFDYLAGKKK